MIWLIVTGLAGFALAHCTARTTLLDYTISNLYPAAKRFMADASRFPLSRD